MFDELCSRDNVMLGTSKDEGRVRKEVVSEGLGTNYLIRGNIQLGI